MSRGFVKEDDQEEIPLVPRRAYLPEGVTNFVTPSGLQDLLAEKQALINDRDTISISNENENEKRITANFINAKLQQLNERIETARMISPEEQPKDEIRFSASVTLKIQATGEIQTFRIVGADEADISKGKLSFLSPLAKLLINKKQGDTIMAKQAGKDMVFEITGISYER